MLFPGAWVVFRWTGVAAPVQRRVWGIPPLVAAGSQILAIAPRMSGRGSHCAHLGSEDGLRGLISMAVASSPRGRGRSGLLPARRGPVWHAISFGNRPGSPLDPIVGGSFEDASC